MKFPDEIKKRAFELYVEGYTPSQIITKINEETDGGVTMKKETISLWAREGNWVETKTLAKVNAYNDVVLRQTRTLADYMQNQMQQMDSLNKLADKANRELDDIPFDKAEGAAKALVDSTLAFSKLAKGMIEIKFVEAISRVLMEEIDDQETLKRIEIKFKKILQETI